MLNTWVVTLITPLLALGIGVLSGAFIMRLRVDKSNKELNKTVDDILERARKEAVDLIKDARLESKDIMHKGRKDLEHDIKERKKDIALLERKLQSKEDALEQKIEGVHTREQDIIREERALEEQKANYENMRSEYIEEIERVSSMTKDEAKNILIEEIADDARLESVRMVREIEEDARAEAEQKARNILAISIQRIASEYPSEITVSTVTLPNEDMKGRIIGKEGRNIKSFEQVTGVDVIIDDTPESVIISSFDPIRREIAKLTLKKLMSDGRIHPAKIEGLYSKAKVDIEKEVLEAGENAIFSLGLHGFPKELKQLIGRLKFRSSYGQNALAHSVEVARVAGHMASELGLDPKMAKRCGLLHDIGKAIDYELEGSHTQIGVDIAKKYKEDWKVSNAILAHHNEEEYKCIESILVHAADIISASRPGARREVLETYIKRMEKLEEIATGFDGVTKSYAIQAGREIRVIVEPGKIGDNRIALLSKDISQRIQEELTYPGHIKVTVIREMRATEYAK